MPTLSIILPSYNYAHYLPEAIDSVLAQDYRDYELIIIDDGSADESPAIIGQYAKAHPNIRPILRKENRGAVATMNEGIEISKGEYIHCFGADDKYLPGFLSKTIALLKQNPLIGLCCSNAAYFHGDEEEKIIDQPLIPGQQHPSVHTPNEMIAHFQDKTHAPHFFWIPGHTTIVKKELIEKFGKFNPKLGYLCDFVLYHSIALNYGAIYIPKPLALWRAHPKGYNKSFRSADRRRTSRELFAYLRKEPLLLDQFRRSSLLAPILTDRIWFRLLNPRFIRYWKYVNLRSPIKKRIIRSIKRHLGP